MAGCVIYLDTMPAAKKTNLTSIKKQLESARKDVLNLIESTVEDRKPVELDQSQFGRLARMDALQIHEMALEQERRREIELQRIDAALKRLEDGEYGFCIALRR